MPSEIGRRTLPGLLLSSNGVPGILVSLGLQPHNFNLCHLRPGDLSLGHFFTCLSSKKDTSYMGFGVHLPPV